MKPKPRPIERKSLRQQKTEVEVGNPPFGRGRMEDTLQETNISHQKKENHLQECLGGGYVSSQEGV